MASDQAARNKVAHPYTIAGAPSYRNALTFAAQRADLQRALTAYKVETVSANLCDAGTELDVMTSPATPC